MLLQLGVALFDEIEHVLVHLLGLDSFLDERWHLLLEGEEEVVLGFLILEFMIEYTDVPS